MNVRGWMERWWQEKYTGVHASGIGFAGNVFNVFNVLLIVAEGTEKNIRGLNRIKEVKKLTTSI